MQIGGPGTPPLHYSARSNSPALPGSIIDSQLHIFSLDGFTGND